MNYIARSIMANGPQQTTIIKVRDIKQTNTTRRDFIMEIVSKYFGVSKEVIKSKSRKREIVYPRQVATYLIHVTTTLSWADISTFLGGKEHSNAIYSCEVIKNLMDTDEKIRNDVDYLRNKI